MKKSVLLFVMMWLVATSYAQTDGNQADFQLGKGLNISLENGKHHLNIGGYLQLDGTYAKSENEESESRFGVKRAYFSLGGDYLNDKFGFLLQMNFADSYPLLDAWMSYKPVESLTVTVGQKQSFSGPRSMMYADYDLNLGDRSLAAQTFFATGRELGLFLETRQALGSLGLDLGVALTSGDGRNSFGSSSSDFDLGGVKYSARTSLYPLGFFSRNNEFSGTDFAREASPKLALGFAYSYNDGASHPIGEGHGDFNLYDKDGKIDYPAYQKISADILFKYSGFSLLAEYVNAVGDRLEGLYTAPSVNSKLQPTQIADYLTLGNGLNVEAGYLFRSNWAVDLRYSTVMPEWSEKTKLIEKTNEYTAGIARYVIDNRLKLQLTGSYRDRPDNQLSGHSLQVQFTAHVLF